MRVFALAALLCAATMAAQDPLLNLKDAEDRRVLSNSNREAFESTKCYNVDPETNIGDSSTEKFWTQCFGKV